MLFFLSGYCKKILLFDNKLGGLKEQVQHLM